MKSCYHPCLGVSRLEARPSLLLLQGYPPWLAAWCCAPATCKPTASLRNDTHPSVEVRMPPGQYHARSAWVSMGWQQWVITTNLQPTACLVKRHVLFCILTQHEPFCLGQNNRQRTSDGDKQRKVLPVQVLRFWLCCQLRLHQRLLLLRVLKLLLQLGHLLCMTCLSSLHPTVNCES